MRLLDKLCHVIDHRFEQVEQVQVQLVLGQVLVGLRGIVQRVLTLSILVLVDFVCDLGEQIVSNIFECLYVS